MRASRSRMGMPIVVEIVGAESAESIEEVFEYFTSVDERFSTYKEGSEIMRINRGELPREEWSADMREVFALAHKTKEESDGYFDIKRPDGTLDPSGIVKGWAILRAADLLRARGFKNFYIDAGGDIQSAGHNAQGLPWSVGIRNPFKHDEIVKIIYPQGRGVATSGTAARGQHIYNPHQPEVSLTSIVSITVVGPDVCEADRFATAAFAMGEAGVQFIEQLPVFEAYAINASGVATLTSGFPAYQTP
jgi:thiamine biosynthesis lipoprotein